MKKREKGREKGFISIILFVVVVLSISLSTFATGEDSTTGEQSITVTLRIEGYNDTIYNKTVDVRYLTDYVSLQDALEMIDEQEADLEFTGTADNYITSINGESSGSFGGYDGWMFAVNDVVSQLSIGDTILRDGDNIVFYYADYPSQYTLVDASSARDGVIRFYSVESNYDDNYVVTGTYESPITDAEVVFNGSEYVTDENGEINIGRELDNGEYTVSLTKTRDTDFGELPVAVRLTDYKIVVSDVVEEANFTAYIIITVFVVILIAVGGSFLIVNRKKKRVK